MATCSYRKASVCSFKGYVMFLQVLDFVLWYNELVQSVNIVEL